MRKFVQLYTLLEITKRQNCATYYAFSSRTLHSTKRNIEKNPVIYWFKKWINNLLYNIRFLSKHLYIYIFKIVGNL